MHPVNSARTGTLDGAPRLSEMSMLQAELEVEPLTRSVQKILLLLYMLILLIVLICFVFLLLLLKILF